VLWEALQLLPVHLLAAIQIWGIISRVSVPALAGMQLAIMAISVVSVRRSADLPVETSALIERKPLPTYIWISSAVLGSSYLLFALNLFTSFPDGSDALAYHLPLAVRWLQTGSLGIPASKVWQFSLPGNAEIGMMLLLSTGLESSVALVNWISVTVLALDIYLLAMYLSNDNKIASITVVLIALSVPIVEFQTFSAYVDLFGTAFIAAAFALFLYGYSREPSSPPPDDRRSITPALVLLAPSLACGISIGTKPIFYFYGAAYCIFVLFSLLRRRSTWRSTFLTAAVIGFGLLLPCIFWFGRGWQKTHNPLYPMRVKVGQHVIFDGYAPSEITPTNFDENFVRSRKEWFVYPWTEWKRDPGYLLIPYGEGSGLGAAFATFVPLSLGFLFLRSFAAAPPRTEQVFLCLLAAGLLVWWFALHRLPRFGLPLVALACVLATPLVTILESYKPRMFGALLACSLIATCAISTFLPFHGLLSRVQGRRWKRTEFYGYPKLIDQLPAGSCLLNYSDLKENNYSLAGKFLSNQVVPNFEQSDHLTNLIEENGIDYIIEVPAKLGRAPLTRIDGTALVKTLEVQTGDNAVNWRIWQVQKHAADKGEENWKCLLN
jgi:hypothetical protein